MGQPVKNRRREKNLVNIRVESEKCVKSRHVQDSRLISVNYPQIK